MSNLSDQFFARMRSAVQQTALELLSLFEIMAGEAAFARDWLNDDLKALPHDAALLEVGGGTFILSCLLAEEGFSVTSIEPVGDGFGEFAPLAKLILAHAKAQPTIAPCRAEDFASEPVFDFAFSVNVMEHVEDIDAVIARMAAALKPQASYHFFCPNYLFPYEPHFNIPLIATKDITQFLFHQRIFAHPMHDPIGTWNSLNWITVPKVVKAARHANLAVAFDRGLFVRMLQRATQDKGFAARRSAWMIGMIRLFMALGLHRLIAFIPNILQPTMDVTLTKRSAL